MVPGFLDVERVLVNIMSSCKYHV